MPNFIKTRQDEIAWNKALDLARERHEERSKNPQLEPIKNIWAYANWLMHNLFRENKSLVLEEKGLIECDHDEQIWKGIRYHAFANRKDLSEEQKYEYIENAFLAYKDHHKGNPPQCRRKLLEFVNTYSPALGSSMLGGGATRGAMVGFGGQREEQPKGPIVYGVDYPGSEADPGSLNDKKAVVVVPDKKDEFKQPTENSLDAQGDVKANVEHAQKIALQTAELEQHYDGKVGDILIKALDILDMSVKDVEHMNAEQLEDLILKAIKIDMKNNAAQPQQPVEPAPTPIEPPAEQPAIKESTDPAQNGQLVAENEVLVERDSPIQKARRLLAIKHKQKKSIEKLGGKKYVLNQNEIVKMMSRYGYKYDKKYKKWAKKRSPTYDARRILSDKYQDKLAVEKDDQGKYKIDQDEVRKRMHAHNYFYDLEKKRWNQKFDQPEAPKPLPVAPEKKPVPPTASIFQPTPVKKPEEPETKPETKPEPKEETPAPKEEKPINPVYTLSNRDKIKEMEARFILGVTNSLADASKFDKNEETGEYTPVVSKEDILNKIQLLKYDWHDDKNVWLNETNSLPQKMFDLKESPKTIMARAYLASINKVNNLKVKEDGTPSVDIDDIDEAMEKEDLYFSPEINRWKVIEEDDDEEEIDEEVTLSEVNDIDYNEEVLCEEYSYEELTEEQEAEIAALEEAAKTVDPKRKYNRNSVKENQGRFLLRAIQMDDYIAVIGTPAEASTKMNLMTDGPQDCVGQDGKNFRVSWNIVEKDLSALNLKFNNDIEFPMWVESGGNDVPSVLTNLINISKEEYIARGILGPNSTKNCISFLFPKSKGDKPTPETPNDEVINIINDPPNGYVWNEDYGWILPPRNSSSVIPSKAERQKAQELLALKKTHYNSLDKPQQTKLKDHVSKNILEKYGKKPYEQMSEAERQKARNQRDKYNDWDADKQTFVKRNVPRPGFLKSLWNVVKNISGKIKRFSDKNAGSMLRNWSI